MFGEIPEHYAVGEGAGKVVDVVSSEEPQSFSSVF